MRILILGASGMLGRSLVRELSRSHEILATVRGSRARARRDPLLAACRLAEGVEATAFECLAPLFDDFRPAAVVNAIGVVKRHPDAARSASVEEVNGRFPHQLAELCRARGARLIHSSTDCVFSGRRGGYSEGDPADAIDDYGRGKLAGEVGAPALTLRWSLIGLEGSARRGLVEWFLGEVGTVRGFERAIFSGLTTAEAARVVHRALVEWPRLNGIRHVAAVPISKFGLLTALGRRVRPGLEVLAAQEPVVDRSLDARRLEAETGYRAPTWARMLAELAAEIEAREATARAAGTRPA